MKIFLAQQNYHIGNFEANTDKILTAVQEAKAAGGNLVVFPELAVCGYPPRDFLEFSDFIDQSLHAIDRIRRASDGIGILVGAPARNPRPEGKDLFNAAYLLHEQEIKAVVHKTLLPTYDIFDEYRYFEPADTWQAIPFMGIRMAVTICEDIWNLGDNPLYRICPMDTLIRQQPDIMINLSASPFDYLQSEERNHIILANVAKYRIPMIYCNTVGAQTEIIFDGGSMAIDSDGRQVAAFPYFEEALQAISFWPGQEISGNMLPEPLVPTLSMSAGFDPQRGIGDIHRALRTGIRDYFSKMGFRKAVVASSGGIDSAVVLALACEALGPANVQALLLPSPYSSDHSVTDAVQLSQNLGNPYEILRIDNIFEAFLSTLHPVLKDTAADVTEENLQSRIRGALAMAWSNKFGAILLNTSNKSELATGYGTLYGDMAGGLSVIGDLYKMQVYALAEYINRNSEIIPGHILTKAPSAELKPGQKDSDSLPDYALLDPLLYEYIEGRLGPGDIIRKGYAEALVMRTLGMVNKNEYKRNQFCPILRISPKAFGPGRRMPVTGKYLW